jgi:DNA invertase Pin-like site-specific DNA recombinase
MEKTNTNNIRFVIYARKSSESEERQALSIQSQIIEMKEIAKRENLKIVKIFQESKSAKEPGRPVFGEMISFIKSKKAEGILCWKIDRIARNPVDEGLVKWMLQNETIKRIKTYDRDYNPEDNVVMASIEFSMATQYIRDLSRNVKRGLAEKVRCGEYPCKAPIGFTNDHKARKLILDVERWQYIKRAFWLYSTGLYSVESISKKLYNEGFRSSTGKIVYHSGIHKILTNPIYYGWFRWKGKIYKGVHPPIVSKNIFDKVEEILFPRKHTKRDNKRNFTFRNFMTCGECGLKITAETKKGHIYYHCTKSRGIDKCAQKYLREEDLIREITDQLARFRIDKEVLDLIVRAAKEENEKNETYRIEIEQKSQMLLEKNRIWQKSLLDKFVQDLIPEKIYSEKIGELKNEEAQLDETIQNTKDGYKDVFEKIELTARFLRLVKKLFKKGDDEVKKEIIAIISSNLVIKDRKIVEFKLEEPFLWLMEDVKNIKGRIGGNQIFEPVSFALHKAQTDPVQVGFHSKLGC